jgi:predicted AAA+ superfamily ATPase
MSRGIKPFPRRLSISQSPNPLTGSAAALLWGPRQTGKTTLLKQRYAEARFFDLLDTRLTAELSIHPDTLRREVLADLPDLVIIDEVQKAPALLEEVHWLLENTATHFVLCGSSARKLKRGAGNLLGGRATEFHLYPLTSAEIPTLDLDRLLDHGGLPTHYLLDEPAPLLRSYINTYLKEEIIDESLTRNIPSFARFLQIVGLTHGRLLNYANVARESGVSANTVRNYYQILIDTLLGFELPPWRKKKNRRLIETAKFYLFDIGVANHLTPEFERLAPGTDLYGRAFEHFLINEIRAYAEYGRRDIPLSFWRTASGFEVDAIIADMDLALEFKSAKRVSVADCSGLRALMSERAVGRAVIVARVERPGKTEDGIEIMPWADFCARLWNGNLF